MKRITSKVSLEDRENARLDRERVKKPADVEPGMDDFDWDDVDDLPGVGNKPAGQNSGGLGSGGLSSGGLGGGMGGGLGTGGLGSGGIGGGGIGGFGSTGGSFRRPFGGFGGGLGAGGFGAGGFGAGGLGSGGLGGNQRSTEDQVWDILKKAGQGSYRFFGEFVNSFKSFDLVSRVNFGKSSIYSGLGIGLFGLFVLIFGGSWGLDFLVGGLLTVGIGVGIFMFSYEEYVKNRDVDTLGSPFGMENAGSVGVLGNAGSVGVLGNDGGQFNSRNDEDDLYSDFEFEDEEEDEGYAPLSFYDEEEDADIDFDGFDESIINEDVSSERENVLSSVNIDKGMVTRHYLYENITRGLMSIHPNYDKEREIKEGTDEFDAWDAIVQNSAELFRGNNEDMPYLISAKEKLFYYWLEIKRVNWLKNLDAFVNEIVNIYRFDKDTGKMDMNVYGIGLTVGDRIYIKIMKGENVMVSLKDIYKSIEDKIKDSSYYMPVVLGLDEEGGVVWRDFKNIDSLLVTGMPRSGKTWFLQSVLGQMMFYLKPSDLHFYILDPKGKISDFYSILTPHVRKFVSTDEEILRELRHIVRVEGERRSKLLGEKGEVNIWDFKEKNPDIELPLIYVVIDEVITLAERMNKEQKDEFQSLILELVSRLPALGIRIFMVPHIVKDHVLKKSITDIIPFRVSVKGDADHIEKCVGVKNFKHKLVHQGNMAVRFGNEEPLFVHSVVLTNSNDGNREFFEFLRKFWSKIEPESVAGSLYEQREKQKSVVNSKNVEVIVNNEGNGDEKLLPKLTSDGIKDLLKGLHDD